MTTSSLWARACSGERFHAGSVLITEQAAHDLVTAAGFSHPLFVDPAYARAQGFDAAPLPGQALLLFMGALAESSGRFDDGVLAMLGYRDVEFRRRVLAGEELSLDVELVGTEPHDEPGRGVVVARFLGTVDGELACTAVVRNLVEVDDPQA